ncbi:MBL fold metallo-hydrolase [Desulfovibrio aminophilus]|nr:MBL fold metallo-hydrolase [Desulfovibrio aminophilus]
MPRLTVLVDNAGADGLASEWGLSMAVETGGGDLWLWDAGASAKFLCNARALGLDPSRARGLALSHGHYDHTGGIPALLDAGFSGPILVHPEANRPRYALHGGTIETVGIPVPLERFEPVNHARDLAPDLTFVTDIPRLPGLPQSIGGLCLDPGGRDQDTVPDDAFLLLQTADGPVAVLGCCHAGLENTLACLRERFGVRRLHGLVGGAHLYNADQKRLDGALTALRDCGLERLHLGHCTGEAAAAWLGERLGCRLEPLRPGLVLDFPAIP